MIDSFARIGERLAKFFGEKEDYGNIRGSYKDPYADLIKNEVLSSVLSYDSWDDSTGIFLQDISAGFILEISPLVGVDRSLSSSLDHLFSDLIDENDSLQIMLWADPRADRFLDVWKNERKVSGVFKDLCDRRADHIREKTSSRLFRIIVSYSSPIQEDKFKQSRELKDKKDAIMRVLSGVSQASTWGPKELLSTLESFFLNPRGKNYTPSAWNPLERISSQLKGESELEVGIDKLNVIQEDKNSEFRSFSVSKYPDHFILGQMGQLIGDSSRERLRIDHPFYIHYGVSMPSQKKESSRFWKRSQNIEVQGKSGALIRMIPSLARELAECDMVRRQLDEGAKLVKTHLSCGVWAPEGEIDSASEQVRSLFRVQGIHLHQTKYLHLPMFLWSLPMMWAGVTNLLNKFSFLKTTLHTECKHFLPIHGEWYGTHSCEMLLLGRRGQLMGWSPFDSSGGNYNCVVVGQSGSGKSVFMQDLLLSGLDTGARVYVLDVGRSFERMCEVRGGQKIEFSSDTQICLNPFTKLDIKTPSDKEDALSCLKSIVSCMAAPQGGTNDYETSLIESAISEAWECKKNSATITDISYILSQGRDEVSKRLGVMLKPYTSEGIYGKYFEGQCNVSFSNPMVLVELEELKEKKDLQSVVLQIFMLTITQQAFMGNRSQRCYICIDEAWDLLRAKQTEVFIETVARRIRKYGGSLVIGTQDIGDFFSAPGANAAYKNSEWSCILSQKHSSLQKAIDEKQLIASPEMKSAIESLRTVSGKYSEVLICDSAQNFSIQRLVLDPFSQLLYTTKAEEFNRIKELQNQGLSTINAIEALLKENQ